MSDVLFKEGKNILVQGADGCKDSGAIVVAFLMRKFFWTLDKAFG